jgi:hypothetical protein
MARSHPLRRLLAFLIVLAFLMVLLWRLFRPSPPRPQPADASPVTINKLPALFAAHTFDPAAPPPDMPLLAPHETAECDSNFQSSAIVRGEPRKADSTHATLTITDVKVTLRLSINLWLPKEAPQNLIDHEEGHRQISEHTYETADKLAERIAASYIGRQVDIAGADLDAESVRVLHQLAAEITSEYNRQLNPNPPQLLFDSITDHAKNGVNAKDAVDHVLKNAAVESPNSPATDN